jgi:hypothetical protein
MYPRAFDSLPGFKKQFTVGADFWILVGAAQAIVEGPVAGGAGPTRKDGVSRATAVAGPLRLGPADLGHEGAVQLSPFELPPTAAMAAEIRIAGYPLMQTLTHITSVKQVSTSLGSKRDGQGFQRASIRWKAPSAAFQ